MISAEFDDNVVLSVSDELINLLGIRVSVILVALIDIYCLSSKVCSLQDEWNLFYTDDPDLKNDWEKIEGEGSMKVISIYL